MMPVFIKFEFPTSADGRYMTIYGEGKILLNRRLLLGLTQEKLADMTNVSVQQIQKLEAGALMLYHLGLRKGLALCAALLLNPYEMAEPYYKQHDFLMLQPGADASSADGQNTAVDSNDGKEKILLKRRLLLKLTQEKLADMTNVSVQQIQQLEAGDISIYRLGLNKGLSLCAALCLDPYEIAEPYYEQPDFITLPSMPVMTRKMPDLSNADFYKLAGRQSKTKNVVVYFNQSFNSSVLISRKALELLNKPKYIQIRWFKSVKFFIITGTETPVIPKTRGIYSFDVPPETYDKKSLGLMIMNFEAIEETVADLNWDEHTYVAKCHELVAENGNGQRCLLCDLRTAKKSDNWKGAFTEPQS